MAGDILYSNVAILVHGELLGDPTYILDYSPTPAVITSYNGAVISGGRSKFGSGSLLCPGTAGARAEIAPTAAMTIGAGDFTVEGWFYTDDVIQPDAVAWAIGAYGTSIGIGGKLASDGTSVTVSLYKFDPYAGNVVSHSSLKAGYVNGWHHIVWQRTSGTVRIYVDGTNVASSTWSGNISLPVRVRLGSMNNYVGGVDDFSVNFAYKGSIDEFRLTVGAARYSSDFTPPTSAFANAPDGTLECPTGLLACTATNLHPLSYRYWRLQVSAVFSAANSVIIDAIELRESELGPNLALSPSTPGTASASSTYSTQTPNKAFDGITGASGFWQSDTVGFATPQWIKWDFGVGHDYEITWLTIANNTSNFLQTAKLQYSVDDVDWTDHIFVSGTNTANAVLTFPYIVDVHCDAFLYAPMITGTRYDTTTSAWVATEEPVPPLFTCSGGTVNIPAPAGIVTLHPGAGGELSSPFPTLSSASGALCAAAPPSPTFMGAGHESTGENGLVCSPPSPTLSAYTGVSAGGLTAPAATLSTNATVNNLGAVALFAPIPTVTSSGTAPGAANAALEPTLAVLVGYSGAVCSITTADGCTILATGTMGAVGRVQITAPLFELTASAITQNSGSANLLAPSPFTGQSAQSYLAAPTATLVAIGHAVVTATYEAYAVNLKHQPKPGKEPVDEVTRYTNFPFTHIVRYQNSYFGANSTGLYLLEGTTDYASPTPTAIPWAFKTAMTDFKSPQHKTVASAYFGGRLGAAATVDLHVGEDGPQTYSYATVRTDHAQNYRQVFGKGTKARYYALGASGTGTLELDDIDLDVHTLSRRI